MQRAPDGVSGWATAWSQVMGRQADDWNVARIQERDVFTAMAEGTGMPLEGVERHAAYDVNAWEASGGTQYWYRDDITFQADLAELTK
jgi:hypothetical protein